MLRPPERARLGLVLPRRSVEERTMVIPRAGLRRGRPSHGKDIMTFLNRYNTSPAYTDDNGPEGSGRGFAGCCNGGSLLFFLGLLLGR